MSDRDDGSKGRASKSEMSENRKSDSKLDSKEDKFETSSGTNKDDLLKGQPSSPGSNKGNFFVTYCFYQMFKDFILKRVFCMYEYNNWICKNFS